ncbi:hypothetical protein YC2023_056779 [Brassica napus]
MFSSHRTIRVYFALWDQIQSGRRIYFWCIESLLNFRQKLSLVQIIFFCYFVGNLKLRGKYGLTFEVSKKHVHNLCLNAKSTEISYYLPAFFFDKLYRLIRSASGGTHLVLQSGLATTLPDPSLEYLSTNARG